MKPPVALGTFIVRFMALVSTYGFTPSSGSSYPETDDSGSTSTTTRNETNDIPPMDQPDHVLPYDEEDDNATKQSYVYTNGKLSCYKCGAYQNHDGEDYDSILDDCMFKAAETAEYEECPNSVMNISTFPSCYVNKMMAAGHITSFSRGCMIYHDCILADYCESSLNKTGACQSCCRENYCNRAAGECLPRIEVFKLLFLTLSTYLFFVR